MNNTTDRVPAHVAIIMDGNGRWAKKRGLERYEGHQAGVNTVRTIVRNATKNAGIRYLTLYVFSTENWGRPQEEVDMLMELLCRSIINELPELKEGGVRVRVLGDRERMSPKVNEHIALIENDTAAGTSLDLLLCINYSSRDEITRAIRRIAERAAAGSLDPSAVTQETLEAELYTHGIPDPDLIIRTGREQRLSNFLLWQGAYSELYFTPVYWPDFGDEDFEAALAEYAKRHRRFGKVEEDETL